MGHRGRPILVLVASIDWVHLQAKEMPEKMKRIVTVTVVCAALAAPAAAHDSKTAAPVPQAAMPATVVRTATRNSQRATSKE
jgi:hypothetical protein